MSSSLLTPDPGLIFWMLIAFGIVVFILSKYGFPVILKKLDSRKKFIDDSLVAAQQAFEELEQVKTKNEQLIERAKKEQMQIISEAAKKRDLILENAHEK
ncbi:MAG: ATP synthase F0 subunit B, partial [Dysgonamonadaceae bacterium]